MGFSLIDIKFALIFSFLFFLNENSNIYYINDNLDKRTWTYIFGACCATTVFIPSFHNYRIWSFLGLGMTTFTAWYLCIAALIHGQVIFSSSTIYNEIRSFIFSLVGVILSRRKDRKKKKKMALFTSSQILTLYITLYTILVKPIS